MLSRFQHTNYARLAENVSRYSDVTRERLAGITHGLIAHGMLPAVAERQALALIDTQVMRLAMMLSFERLFLLFGLGFVIATPLLLLMRKGRSPQAGSAGASH